MGISELKRILQIAIDYGRPTYLLNLSRTLPGIRLIWIRGGSYVLPGREWWYYPPTIQIKNFQHRLTTKGTLPRNVYTTFDTKSPPHSPDRTYPKEKKSWYFLLYQWYDASITTKPRCPGHPLVLLMNTEGCLLEEKKERNRVSWTPLLHYRDMKEGICAWGAGDVGRKLL